MSKVTSTMKTIREELLLRWPALSYVLLPFIILIFIIAFCLVTYIATSINLEDNRTQAVERRLNEVEHHVETVFLSYADLLDGSTGMIQFGQTDETSWKNFIAEFDLQNNYSGMEAIGVAAGQTPISTKIVFGAPETPATLPLRGYSITDDNPQTIPSFVKSMVDNEEKISDTMPDVFSTKPSISKNNNGFVMVEPYYDTSLPIGTPAERSQALRGYSVALFRGDVFFRSIFDPMNIENVDIQVYLGDINPKNLQYEIKRTTSKFKRSIVQRLEQYGNTFTIVYSFDTNKIVPLSANYAPQVLLFSGMFTGIIIAIISGIMLRNRYKFLAFQNERDIKFAKDELLSLASHQLRTPATGVKQYLGMVLQGFTGDLNDRQRAYLERAYSSNNRQLHVINDILHLAKIEAGRIILSEHKFDLVEMIREVVNEQRDEARKGEVILDLQAPPRGIMIGDSHMMRMVVENLLSNAIKYTPPKGEVTVRVYHRTKTWNIVIRDTGVGIAPKDLSKLFQQFTRINNVRTKQVTGTGIGLYLAHHLVVLHGGTISVSSKPGKGSVFTVRIPRKK